MNTSVFGSSVLPGDEPGYEPRDAAPQLPVGTSIQGKYVVHGVLGLGGFAVVYDAEHVGLGRRVAIKVMHLATDTPAALLERFRREARISALVRHRNVLEVYDTGTLPDGSPFLVMERVNGRNLSHVLREGPLPIAAAVEITRQVLTALCALEDAGVLHRDIKPDNLMMHDAGDGAPTVKLVDFGISKRTALEPAAKLTCHGTLVGTPQYMSPEAIRGQEVDLRTDLYATGAVLYETLGGHAPHESQNFSELVVAVLNAPLRPLRELRANCPPELERIATKALARSAQHRYASPRDMLSELEACARELELPRGAAAFESDDPIDPIWTTPARISFPALQRWWQRGITDARRPLQVAAGVLLLAAPGAALRLYRADAPAAGEPAVAAAGAVGNPVLPVGLEPPEAWSSASAMLPEVHHAFSFWAEGVDRAALSPLASYVADGDSEGQEAFADLARAADSFAALEADESAHDRRVRLKAESARRAIDELAATGAAPVAVVELPPQVEEPKLEAPKAEAPKAEAPRAEAPKAEEAPDPAVRARWERAMDEALANMVRGELQAAKSHYAQATALQAGQAAGWRGLGLVCARLGHDGEARSALKHYLALAPHAGDVAMIQSRLAALH